jgi:hypothetical protein
MSLPISVFLAAFAVLATGCKTNEDCTRSRLEASDSWKDIQEKASKWKLQGAVGYEDYDARQKGDHYKSWNAIEANSEVIWKSFAYEKITWSAADPARNNVNKEFKGYWAADKYSSFASQLEGANKRFDSVKAKCQ